jgi:HD-GYP domain-containing protein (c-di-GMP phosphodiesterase class II)
VAAAHHERLDGRGYFPGLGGAGFPLEARILATADMVDALPATRPYRPAMPVETALRILERDRGTAVEPECLDTLLAIVEDTGVLPGGDEAASDTPAASPRAAAGQRAAA